MASEIGIDENDLWIAAQAAERGLVLVTADKMNRIKTVADALAQRAVWRLDTENWEA